MSSPPIFQLSSSWMTPSLTPSPTWHPSFSHPTQPRAFTKPSFLLAPLEACTFFLFLPPSWLPYCVSPFLSKFNRLLVHLMASPIPRVHLDISRAPSCPWSPITFASRLFLPPTHLTRTAHLLWFLLSPLSLLVQSLNPSGSLSRVRAQLKIALP
jgi:hypothetical protein